jgi:hypothetical protein
MVARNLLLVEGPDDKHVLKHLCDARGVPVAFENIVSLGGVEHLLESLPFQLEQSGIEALGVVVDADTDLAARWQSLRDRLVKAGYEDLPISPTPTGTILQPPPDALLPRVGVWIMPDNQTKGILEDFLRFLVPAESRLFDHVQSSVKAIPSEEKRFSQLAEPKALIHTWLAWQKEPGKPFGLAITEKFLDSRVAQVDVLVDWLKQLFFP